MILLVMDGLTGAVNTKDLTAVDAAVQSHLETDGELHTAI
jgi:hypothetical protein